MLIAQTAALRIPLITGYRSIYSAENRQVQTAIIHCGVHKTGTSSIQIALQNYDDGDTAYANLGEPNHSHFFSAVFSDNLTYFKDRIGLSQRAISSLIKNNFLKLDSELQRPRQRKIFSGEDISTLSAGSLNELKAHFEKRDHRVQIIVFLREPIAWTASMTQEMLKHGFWIKNELPIQMNLSKRIMNLQTVFGKDNVQIRHYEDAAARGGMVAYFAELLDLQSNRIAMDVSVNKSIGELTFKLLNKFNQSGVRHRKGYFHELARFRFIDTLNEILCPPPSKLPSPGLFRSRVDWQDFIELNKLIDRPYAIRNKPDEPQCSFLSYLDDIDHSHVIHLLSAHLKSRHVHVSGSMDAHELTAKLFHETVRRMSGNLLAYGWAIPW